MMSKYAKTGSKRWALHLAVVRTTKAVDLPTVDTYRADGKYTLCRWNIQIEHKEDTHSTDD